jgi:hypothetical protein
VTLGLGVVNAKEAYAAQPSIEAALARQHLSDLTLVLYDVSLCAEWQQPLNNRSAGSYFVLPLVLFVLISGLSYNTTFNKELWISSFPL